MFLNNLRARSFFAFVAFAASMASAAGCTPSPEDTCHRLDDLGRKDPAGFNLSMSKCLARMTEMKQRDPDAYKCTARTVAKLSSIDTALLAVSVCDQGGPSSKGKKRSGDE
jgi:hypothetical protein